MVDAGSKYEFEETLKLSVELLRAQAVRDGILESKLDEFAQHRETYALYCIRSILGNRGLLGDAASEQIIQAYMSTSMLGRRPVMISVNIQSFSLRNYCRDSKSIQKDE